MVKLRNINDLKKYWSDGGRKLLVSYHKHRSMHLDFQFRYLISYKNAKKANPENEICPYSKMKASLNAVVSSNFSSYINL